MNLNNDLFFAATNLMGSRFTSVQAMTTPATKDPTARSGIDSLELRVDRQNMLIQTLLMLLLEKKVIQEDEFREWLKYVDGLDGRVDGRLRPSNSPVACSACGRNNGSTAVRCQYCGHEFKTEVTDSRAKQGGPRE